MVTNSNELLSAIDIVDLLTFCAVDLKQIGKEFHAPCPFHRGKSKTVFSVNREKKVWYCFKCKRGGNMIKFLMIFKNCSYSHALDYLDLFYRQAKLSKTTSEIYEFALRLLPTIETSQAIKKAA